MPVNVLPAALEWKYGLVADTAYDTVNEKSVITSWRHVSILEPSEEQLVADIDEYLIYKTAKDATEGADAAQKMSDIAANLPSWQEVSDNVDAVFADAQQRATIKKGFRILYWLAKNTSI